jgi:hypothetical protein
VEDELIQFQREGSPSVTGAITAIGKIRNIPAFQQWGVDVLGRSEPWEQTEYVKRDTKVAGRRLGERENGEREFGSRKRLDDVGTEQRTGTGSCVPCGHKSPPRLLANCERKLPSGG